MKTNAVLLYQANGNEERLTQLEQLCQSLKMAVQREVLPEDEQGLHDLLGRLGSAIIFLPTLEEDCLGIKLVQGPLEEHKRVVVMYGESLPSKQYLCLAFREGVDDVLTWDSSPESWPIQLRRAEKLLQNRMQSLDISGQLSNQLEGLQLRCEQLERVNARWEERILSLATTATRMATGELRLAETAPQLLIVTESQSQAHSAAELAKQLGFMVATASGAQDALEEIKKHPPRIILTTTKLADMELTAFAHAARHTLGAQPVMIVAWSSSPEAEDQVLQPETGIDDFILKSASSESNNLLVTALLSSLR